MFEGRIRDSETTRIEQATPYQLAQHKADVARRLRMGLRPKPQPLLVDERASVSLPVPFFEVDRPAPRPWSSHEVETLRSMAAAGRPAPEIARAVGKSRDAIGDKARRLGISLVRLRPVPAFKPPASPIPPLPRGPLTIPLRLQSKKGILRILLATVYHFGYSMVDLRGPCREAKLAFCRQVGMYVGRKAGYSFPAIGRQFNRDHSTAIHAFEKISELRSQNQLVADHIAAIEAMLMSSGDA